MIVQELLYFLTETWLPNYSGSGLKVCKLLVSHYICVGQYQISDLAQVSRILYDEYGQIVKLSGLIGRPDLLFVYDADETEKVYRLEGDTPYRPSMPCLVQYKSVVRKDFFGRLPGVVGV